MTPHTEELHLRIVGVLHLVVAALGVAVHRHFRWGAEIQRLTLLTRQVFLIHSAAVTVVLVMIGVLLAGYAPPLLAPPAPRRPRPPPPAPSSGACLCGVAPACSPSGSSTTPPSGAATASARSC